MIDKETGDDPPTSRINRLRNNPVLREDQPIPHPFIIGWSLYTNHLWFNESFDGGLPPVCRGFSSLNSISYAINFLQLSSHLDDGAWHALLRTQTEFVCLKCSHTENADYCSQEHLARALVNKPCGLPFEEVEPQAHDFGRG